MGFCPEETIYRLRFTNPDMQGLIVEAREAPLGIILDVVRLKDIDPKRMTTDDLKVVNELFIAFVESVVEWNLEDKSGVAVPITLEGLRRYGKQFAFNLALTWANAGADVPAPLENRSNNGQPSVAASIPMETL
jgi:hypothetical protein